MPKRKTLNESQVAELQPLVIRALATRLAQIGIVKLDEFGKDKFLRNWTPVIDIGHYHDVKKRFGFRRMLRAHPDKFVFFDPSGNGDEDQFWLRFPGDPPVHRGGSEQSPPCPAFLAHTYCKRGFHCSHRHDPADWLALHPRPPARPGQQISAAISGTILSEISDVLKRVGLIAAATLVSDDFIGKVVNLDLKEWHGVRRLYGDHNLLFSRPEQFVVFQNGEHIWVKSIETPEEHLPFKPPCADFIKYTYCMRGLTCTMRHSPRDVFKIDIKKGQKALRIDTKRGPIYPLVLSTLLSASQQVNNDEANPKEAETSDSSKDVASGALLERIRLLLNGSEQRSMVFRDLAGQLGIKQSNLRNVLMQNHELFDLFKKSVRLRDPELQTASRCDLGHQQICTQPYVPPHPDVFTRCFTWTADAQKFKSSEKQILSPAYEVSFGPEHPSVIFRIMLSAKVASNYRGGTSFCKANGKGFVQLKFASPAVGHVQWRVAVGQETFRGLVMHDLSENAVSGLSQGQEEFDFISAANGSRTCPVCVEIALAVAQAVRPEQIAIEALGNAPTLSPAVITLNTAASGEAHRIR